MTRDTRRARQAGSAEHSGNETRDDEEEVTSLEELLGRVDAAAAETEQTAVGDVLDYIGARSFAPVLLVAGLVMLAPVIGDIPGVPVLMGLIVVLTAAQLLARREHIWLPDWILRRSIDHRKVQKAVAWLRRPARFLDRWTKPRQTRLVRHAGAYVIASSCLFVAAATPIMELVPFSANLAGVAITAFGLSLIARDGVLAIIAIVFCVGTIGLIVYQFV